MKEKLNNKTCKDCRYMLHKDTFEVCTLRMTETAMFDNACEHFTPPTVGDRIRQMSDEELAEFLRAVKRCPPGECRSDRCALCWLQYIQEEAKDE
jgi:hypothetical protein